MDIWAAVADERCAAADLLADLTQAQWSHPSLCSAWTVKDVAVHLVPTLGKDMREFAVALVEARGRMHRASQTVVARYAASTPTTEVVVRLREDADVRFVPPGLPAAAPLVDVLVHRLDIAVPLGLEQDRPVEPWGPALEFLLSPPARRGFVKRLMPKVTVVATDLLVDGEPWTSGSGPEVTGPAAALGLALSGRSAWLDRLAGPGRESLSYWAR